MQYFQYIDDSLRASFRFADFSQAFAFMCRVALLAERLQHHPEWSNVYNRVDICLRTHDAGNTVTELDREMAVLIEQLFEN